MSSDGLVKFTTALQSQPEYLILASLVVEKDKAVVTEMGSFAMDTSAAAD